MSRPSPSAPLPSCSTRARRRAGRRALLGLLIVLAPSAAALDVAGLGAAITRLGLEGGGGDGFWRLVAGGRAVVVTADAAHDRLRIQAHVTAAEALDEALLRRVLVANFGTAGDARYAIDGTTLWSVFVHPLADLDAEGFAVALAQVVNLAADFGQDYGSGLFATRAGAGTPRGRELIDALRGRVSGTAP